MGKIIAICTSYKKGIQKQLVNKALFIPEYGIEGDAHADNWHRQISFLAKEDIDEFNKLGANVSPGAFGENLIISGIDLKSLMVGDLLKAGNVLFEISQKGKECHDHCAIYYKMGQCIMPRLGVFAKVINGGELSIGDDIIIVKRDIPFPFQAAVITLSDSGFNRLREDVSGPLICDYLKEKGYKIIEHILLPDDKLMLKKELTRLCDQRQVDVIITTGGTGFSKRDVTPEATLEIMDRNAPGIAEAIRFESMKYTKHAMLSRGVSAIRGKSLIINLPGSPKACKESLDIIIDSLKHAIGLLRDDVSNCASKE